MVSVPVLVTLTDRIDAKRVYLFGVGCTVLGALAFGLLADGFWSAMALRALAGLGWAGTYMTGLKLLADQVDAKMMSRAVTGHAASIGISGARVLHAGRPAGRRSSAGRRPSPAPASPRPIAWLTVALAVPGRPPPPAKAGGQPALFDFRPVLRNRSALAYSLAYCVHTLEMNALRGWGVAFLAWVAVEHRHGGRAAVAHRRHHRAWPAGHAASVLGNEASIRFGRRRLIVGRHGAVDRGRAAAGLRRLDGLLARRRADRGLRHDHLARFLVADRRRRGRRRSGAPRRHARRAFDAGLRRRLRRAAGHRLDARCSPAACRRMAWGLAFGVVAVLMALAMAVFLAIRPRELEGDRGG